MCIDKNCDCLDEPCCPLRTKALFYAYWTLVHHVILVILVFYSLIGKNPQQLYPEIYVDIQSLINSNA